MSSEVIERFVIAVSRLLGENPLEPGVEPLSELRICEGWLVDEVLETVEQTGQLKLDFDKFNQIMLQCGRRIATPHFYEYFFRNTGTIDSFEEAVENFRKKAMWLYGNFRFAYKRLATTPRAEFEKLIRSTEPVDPAEFGNRSEFCEIEPIPLEDLPLLGYVSRGKIDSLDFSLETVSLMLANPPSIPNVLKQLGAEKQERISATLASVGVTFPRSGSGGIDPSLLTEAKTKLTKTVADLKARAETAMAVGRRNTQRYMSLPYLDVYCATSMRQVEDFKGQHAFTTEVFRDEIIKPLNLRFFDPTLSYVDDRVTKGLIECLMLRRARVTIYNADKEDTLGKDSELAATLAQGKHVIVYVPKGLDKRAQTFKVDHPLGLQVDVRTGVAHGIIVVRSAKECAKMLRKVILRELEFSIRHEGGNYLLEEKETRSVLRVVSDDPFLTHAFWTYFHRLH